MRSPTNIASAPINLDHPGTYLHWSIFTVSVANLCLIGVMVVIFGRRCCCRSPGAAPIRPAAERNQRMLVKVARRIGRGRDMWTNRARRFATRVLRRASCCPTGSPPMCGPGCTCSGWAAWPRSAWRAYWASRWPWAARTGGATTRSATSLTACTCGASSCSWPCWSSTCGASSRWPPGAAGAP